MIPAEGGTSTQRGNPGGSAARFVRLKGISAMTRPLLAAGVALLLAVSSLAQGTELSRFEVDRLVASYLAVCPDPVKVTSEPLQAKLGGGLRASIIRVESENPWCGDQLLGVATRGNTYALAMPWVLAASSGATPEAKIRDFAWTRLQSSVDVGIGSARRADGLIPVTVTEKTEAGPVKIEGVVDPEVTIFLPGSPVKLEADAAAGRMERLASIVAAAPARGAAGAKAVVYEFSDFQCPACARASGFADALLAELGDRVRYVRIDLPLISSHPWAFPAAVMGRAIYQQSPEAFWEFKKAVYESQSDLNAFTIEEFARGFVVTRELDEAKFGEAIGSQKLRDEILAAVGAARTLGIGGTPTFLVNGRPVVPGEDGKLLIEAAKKAGGE